MLLNTFKTWVIVLGVLLASSVTSTGQTFKGCGVLINSDGNILTSTQVIREPSDSIVVELWMGNRYPATIKSVDKAAGLVLLSIANKQEACGYLRMKDKELQVIPPRTDELSSVIGYLDGRLSSRGALIGEINDPNQPAGHFRVRMGCAYNCAGAPIIDDNAMLIGIIDKGTTECDTVKQDSTYEPPAIYGLDATLILPFLDEARVETAISDLSDPYKLNKLSPFDRLDEAAHIGGMFAVQIFDKK